jgi:hypothetical protein
MASNLMGYSNAAAVYANWTHLPDKAFRALGQMALISSDPAEDSPPGWRPHYWGGWAMLATASGKTVPPDCARGCGTGGCPACNPAQQTVKRVVRELIKAGAIEQVRGACRGVQAEYALNVHRHAPMGSLSDTQSGSLTDTQPGSLSDTPNRTVNNTYTTTSSLVSTSPAPVDNNPAETISCPGCGWQAWEGHLPGCQTESRQRTKEPAA